MENVKVSLRDGNGRQGCGPWSPAVGGSSAADSPSFPLLPQSHQSPAYRTASGTMTETYGNPRPVGSVSATTATCCAMT